jgi:hypothetical protein
LGLDTLGYMGPYCEHMQDSLTATQKGTTETEPVAVATVRLPESLWVAVKVRAATERTSAQQITIDALTAYLGTEAQQAA